MEKIILVLQNPAIMISIVAVAVLRLFPPRKINGLYGYRTKRSMQSQKKWDFAQKYSAGLGLYLMAALLAVQVLTTIVIPDSVFSRLGLIALLLIAIAFVIYKTERELGNID